MAYRHNASQDYPPIPQTASFAPSGYNYETPPPVAASYTGEYQSGYGTAGDGTRGYYDQAPPRPLAYPPATQAPFYPPMPSRHMRHQSTPNAVRTMQTARTLSGNGAEGMVGQVHYENGPIAGYQHVRHQSHAAIRTGMPRLDEDRDGYFVPS